MCENFIPWKFLRFSCILWFMSPYDLQQSSRQIQKVHLMGKWDSKPAGYRDPLWESTFLGSQYCDSVLRMSREIATVFG